MKSSVTCKSTELNIVRSHTKRQQKILLYHRVELKIHQDAPEMSPAARFHHDNFKRTNQTLSLIRSYLLDHPRVVFTSFSPLPKYFWHSFRRIAGWSLILLIIHDQTGSQEVSRKLKTPVKCLQRRKLSP